VHYRCYLLNLHSRIERAEMIEAETDADAVARGDAIFRERGAGFSRIEVWDRGRRLERQSDDGPEQIRRWRMKAEELRTTADGFANGAALQSSAATYDTLADNAEARLQRRKDEKSDAG
jgi:hypothetical protein